MVTNVVGQAEIQDRAERNAETRDRLLDGAIRIASSRGLDKVTSRAVGAETGLSHSLVRFYFGSVDEMISAALERAARLDVAEGPLLARNVDDFASHVAEAVSSNRARNMLQFDYLIRAVRGRVPVERVIELYDFYQSEVAATLENIGVDDADGSKAALIFAALDGLILQDAVYGSPERTNRVLQRLREVLRLLQTSNSKSENSERR